LKDLREKQAAESGHDSGILHEMSREDIEILGSKLAQKVRSLTHVADNLDKKDVKIIMIHLLVEWHLLIKKNVRRGANLYHLPIFSKE
jgi:hypothetical protein